MHRSHSMLLALLLLLISPLAVLAQTSNATVLGVIKDTAGTTISGAEVRLENTTTGFTRSVIAGADCQYQLLDVPAGTYTLTVTATGFRTASGDVTITSDARQIFDLGLDVRGADALTIDTNVETAQREDSIVGGIIDSRRVQDLQLNVRKPYNFVQLLPGAVQAPPEYSFGTVQNQQDSAVQGSKAMPFTLAGLRGAPAVNGNRPISSNYQLDGVDNNNQTVAGYNLNISPEAVQELRVATHNYSAEYGRNSGFISNIQTKTGSTEFHGSAFLFHNNDALNANSFFAGFVQPNTALFNEDNRDRIRRNQYGANFGGPLGSDRVLFFGAAEWHRERSSLINTLTVPTRDYINLLIPGTPQRTLLELFPNTTPSFGFFDGNFDGIPESGIGVAAITRHTNQNMFSLRTDFVPNNSNRVTVRYAYDDYDQDAFQGQLPGAGFGYQGFGTKISNRSQNALLQWVHLFNHRAYNDFTFGYNRNHIFARQPIAADVPLVLVQPTVPIQPSRQVDLSVPEIEDLFTGVSLPSLRSDLPLRHTENTFQFRDIVSITSGDHHLKFGAEYRRLLAPSFFQAFSSGKFTFLGLCGGDNSFADGAPLYTQFLIDPANGGLPDTYRTFRRNEGMLFIQDDIKVTKSFTINLGLRYEYYGVISSKRPAGIGNVDANFIFDPVSGGFVPTDLNGGDLQDRLYNKDTNNFAPRIGFAYDLGGNGRGVIRAGYGIFYDRVLNRVLENARFNAPFASIGLFTGGPINTFNTPLDRTEVALSTFAPTAFAVDRNLSTPYVQQWFVGFQRDLGGNTVLELNYIGNTGRGLVVTSDVNRFPGSRFVGRPDPNVSRVFLTETTAKSFYNAFQVNVNRRFANSFQANFTYTYSHAIDEVSDPLRGINGGSFGGGVSGSEAFVGPMEVRNFRLDRGSSDFDVRHRAMINFLYELPFARSSVLGGWQLNSIITLQSGQPFSIFSADDANGDLIFNDRAVYTGSGIGEGLVDDPKENGLQYLNAGLFTSGTSFGFGNSGALGRNVFVGPGFYNVDMAILKNTKLTESVNLQLRAEFFNLFNRVNFMNPHGNISNPATFNLLTNTYNPRMIQLALRLQF